MASRARNLQMYERRHGKLTYIKYEAEFKDVHDNTVEIPDPSKQAHKDAREKALEAGRAQGLKDSEISYTAPMVEADFADVVIWFANNIPWERDEADKPVPTTPEDMGNALDVIRAFQNPSDGYVKLNEGALSWLVQMFKDHGSKAYAGVIPALILERLADTSEGMPPEIAGPRLVKVSDETPSDEG